MRVGVKGSIAVRIGSGSWAFLVALLGRPRLARALVAALADADRWLRQHGPAGAARVLRRVAPRSISSASLVAAARATMRIQPRSPRLTRRGYRTSTRLLLQTGALERPAAFADIVDCRFAGCGR